MNLESIDYGPLAISRIAQQYKNLPKFTELVSGLAELVEEHIESPAANISDMLDIDLMGGANLDVIGRIVGQPREIINYDIIEFFGYDGATGAGTYGDESNPAIGARYRSENESVSGGNTTLEDPEYRTFIKARILKNYGDSTPESIRVAAKALTGATQVRITDGDMEMEIGILGAVDETTLSIMQNNDILPRPTGVGFSSVFTYGLLGFDGLTTTVNFPSDAAYNIGTNDFTIKLGYILRESNYPTFSPLYEHGTLFLDGLLIYVFDGMITVNENSTFKTFRGDTQGLIGVKYNVLLTKTGTDLIVKINGVTEISETVSSDFGSTQVVNIGDTSSIFSDVIVSDVVLINNGVTAIDAELIEGSGTVATNNGTGSNGTITDPEWVDSV